MAGLCGHTDRPPTSWSADFTVGSPANPAVTAVSVSSSSNNSRRVDRSMALRTRLALLVRVHTLPALCHPVPCAWGCCFRSDVGNYTWRAFHPIWGSAER
jgi:hypothetical protein